MTVTLMHGSTEYCWGTIPIRACSPETIKGVERGHDTITAKFRKVGHGDGWCGGDGGLHRLRVKRFG